jgi:hypothetical protein
MLPPEPRDQNITIAELSIVDIESMLHQCLWSIGEAILWKFVSSELKHTERELI